MKNLLGHLLELESSELEDFSSKTFNDFPPSITEAVISEYRDFREKADQILLDIGLGANSLEDYFETCEGRIPHLFFCVRNHHGSSFTDDFWGDTLEAELAKRLAALASQYRQLDVYVGDDGKVYIAGYE
jgi:hypothetical protein